MRNWGLVRMPVRVKREGPELRRPEVNNVSVELAGMVVPPRRLPGKVPSGLDGKKPGLGAAMPLNEGAVPAWPPMVPWFMRTLPKYQSKPRALASSWETSTNLALMLIWGG